MHHFSTVHSVEEDQALLLYLANAPYFLESDYMSKEAKMFKLLKQKVLRQQEDAKAREDLLLQKQLALGSNSQGTGNIDTTVDDQTAKPLEAHQIFYFA